MAYFMFMTALVKYLWEFNPNEGHGERMPW